MENEKITSIRDWVEPAHPAVHVFQNILKMLCSRIREKYQDIIDKTFDQVSRQIGFVVATTLPVLVTISAKGKIKSLSLGAEHLKDTVFEKEFSSVFKSISSGDKFPIEQTGKYRLYFLWFEALKLKMRADWIEPAHHKFPLRCKRWELVRPPSIDWIEPAHPPLQWGKRCVEWEFGYPHWLDWVEPAHVPPDVIDPRDKIDPHPDPWQDKVVIAVIDEVYPELRLIERLAKLNEIARRRVRPEVIEPAHFRGLSRVLPQEALAEIEAIVRRYK